MTPVALAYLKHFLYDQSLRKYFIVNYKKHHLKNNPESLEQYLMNADIGTVFLKAFFFFTSGTPSYDYWKDVNDKWLKYWEINKSNVYNTNWMFLKGSFAILRQNWDDYSEKPKVESFEDTYKRLNVVSPYSGSEESDKDAQSLQEKIESKEKAADGVLDGFQFDEQASSRNKGYKIKDNKITINTSSGYRITFSVVLSAEIIKSGYRFVRLATKKETKEVAFVFGDNGINLAGFSSVGKRNINLNSKSSTRMLRRFYGIRHDVDFFELKTTNITNTPNNLIMIFSYEH